jgi:hypothetical protein
VTKVTARCSNISWGDGSPVEFMADSPDLLLFDPIALDFLRERLATLPQLSHEALRVSVIALCQEMGDIAHYQIDNFSPGLFQLQVGDIRKFGSEEEEMNDEEWERWQAEENEPDPGPPRYVGVDSGTILLADISHLRQLTELLTPEEYDRASVVRHINKALGGPYYGMIIANANLGFEFDGDGTYTLRTGAVKPVNTSS